MRKNGEGKSRFKFKDNYRVLKYSNGWMMSRWNCIINFFILQLDFPRISFEYLRMMNQTVEEWRRWKIEVHASLHFFNIFFININSVYFFLYKFAIVNVDDRVLLETLVDVIETVFFFKQAEILIFSLGYLSTLCCLFSSSFFVAQQRDIDHCNLIPFIFQNENFFHYCVTQMVNILLERNKKRMSKWTLDNEMSKENV